MFAAIYVPDFALQCVLRREPELRSCALAIVDGGLPARVRQATPAALARGVASGMTTTQALGRCTSLLFRTPAESLVAAASVCLLQCAESFSPWLEATQEGVVTLEWRGETDWERRAQEIVVQLENCDFSARVGVAENPDLARLAAHSAAPVRVVKEAAEFLPELFIEALAEETGTIADPAAAERQNELARIFRLLHRWGIHTLGEFSSLPREQVVRRLGARAGELWDQAGGRAHRLLRLVRVPEIYAEAMELEHELETLEPLLFILRRFLEQLTARLATSYRAAATMELKLRLAEGRESKFDPGALENAACASGPAPESFPTLGFFLRIPAPTADVDVLFRILETYLENLTAEAPIIGIELTLRATLAEQKQFSLLEGGLRDSNSFYETLARLQALLGPDRVGTPVAADTHRPDAFHIVTPRFEEAPPLSPNAGQRAMPLQRFRPSLPADVQESQGRPVRVFSEKAFGEVTACRGPWRGSGDWWNPRAWERIEWDVQVGAECYRLAHQGGAWFLDGSYD
ncbi:MAG TPA: hypothetical protein VF593_09045 [Chthoniobacteraceae bacterium]|jgi:protein ImuB